MFFLLILPANRRAVRRAAYPEDLLPPVLRSQCDGRRFFMTYLYVATAHLNDFVMHIVGIAC